MTKVEFYNEILANETLTAEQVEFLTKERDLVIKRNSRKSTKPTKAQIANIAVKESIANALAEASEPIPAKAVGELIGISVQKASALLKQMVEGGEVVKSVVTGKSLFTLAE